MLTLYPDINPNCSSKASTAGRDTIRSDRYNERPSAFNETLCSVSALKMPKILKLLQRATARGSIVESKRFGLSRHH